MVLGMTIAELLSELKYTPMSAKLLIPDDSTISGYREVTTAYYNEDEDAIVIV